MRRNLPATPFYSSSAQHVIAAPARQRGTGGGKAAPVAHAKLQKLGTVRDVWRLVAAPPRQGGAGGRQHTSRRGGSEAMACPAVGVPA